MDDSGARAGAAKQPSESAASLLTRRTVLGLLGAGTLAACTYQRFSLPLAPAGHVFYGAATPRDNLDSFEDQLGERLACYRSFFTPGEESQLVEQASTDIELGRVPLTSIKPPGSWAETATNTAWLDSLMEPLSELEGPVYLIVHHEPENDVHAFGEPADYVALQRAALDRAAMVGVNVVVVPILSTWSFDEQANRRPKEWNVDEAPIYGLDLYNPWSSGNGSPWVPFADKLALAEKEAAGRPVLIGEYGCRSDPAQPGRAAQWLRDAFRTAWREDVVAMAYFNSAVGATDGTWELDAETFPVFSDLLRDRRVARL